MSRRKKKGSWQQLIASIPMILAGFILGYSIPDYFGIFFWIIDSPVLFFLLFYGTFLAIFFSAYFLHILIHESGHMIFGWLTGYKLASFRVGSWMLIKQDEKWKWKRFTMAGTGGQCLMDPPDFKDGRMPYVLYNMGGCILNVLVSIVCIIPYLLLERNLLKIFVLAIILLGFTVAWSNGIPLQMKMINNDGYNAMSLGKQPKALYAFWVVLKSNANLARGKRTKDLPEAWFPIPPKEYLGNSIIVNHAVDCYGRLIDLSKVKEAMELSDMLLEDGVALAGIHRHMLICDKIFFELITENRKEIIDKWMDKQQKRFMKAMKSYPAVIRLNYAYALLYHEDVVAAKRHKNDFEKIAAKYPYPAEIESERELMAAIEAHVLEINDSDIKQDA